MPKKILVISQTFPPDAGGEAEYIYNFSKYLAADLTVLSYEFSKLHKSDKKFYKRLDKFTVKRIRYFLFFPTLTRFIALIVSVFLHLRTPFNLIICNHIIMGYIAIFFKKAFKVKYYIATHGWEVAKEGIYSGKYISVIKEAEKVIANSNFTKEEILKQYPLVENITVIPPMVNSELIEEKNINTEFKKQIGLKSKHVLLTVSRITLMEGHKGHDLVLMALPEILKKHPDAVYLIVGNGDARGRLKEFARHLGIADKVIFHDYDRANIHNYYNICDIFIMPSRQIKKGGSVEGFGIVYLEAALFGKPSIGGKSGGISDAIIDGKTGLLVNPSDISEISGAVIKLLDDPEYAKKLGLEAKRRALDEFSGERIGVEIEKLFIE